jgi:hypothetical protein
MSYPILTFLSGCHHSSQRGLVGAALQQFHPPASGSDANSFMLALATDAQAAVI